VEQPPSQDRCRQQQKADSLVTPEGEPLCVAASLGLSALGQTFELLIQSPGLFDLSNGKYSGGRVSVEYRGHAGGEIAGCV
jgi:hypothetical protein